MKASETRIHPAKVRRHYNTRFKRWVLLSLLFMSFSISAGFPSGLNSKISPGLLDGITDDSKIPILVLLTSGDERQESTVVGMMSDAQVSKQVDLLQNKAAISQASITSYLDSLHVQYKAYWISNVIALVGNRALIEKLAEFPEVNLIEPDEAFRVDLGEPKDDLGSFASIDTIMSIQPNLVQVRAPEVWARGFTGQGAVIAVADTGVLWAHPALLDQYRGWDGSTSSNDYNWWDSIHETISGLPNLCGYDVAYPCDDYGHGTHVTGIAVGDDGTGNQIGMAPGARWIGCRNMDNGVGRPSTYIECLQFFIAPTDLSGMNPRPDLRPDVINNSYSCPAYEQCESHSLQAAVENVRAAGIFMSVSAGNSGPACETINTPPALEDSVFTIGAVASTDIIASFSSRGPVTIDGGSLLKPDLVGPGVSIFSALSSGGYGIKSGTSMAAPHISGAVALLWGAYPLLKRDVLQTEQLLETTASPLTSSQGCGGDTGTQIPNNVYGSGRLDVKAAYDAFWPFQLKQILVPIFR